MFSELLHMTIAGFPAWPCWTRKAAVLPSKRRTLIGPMGRHAAMASRSIGRTLRICCFFSSFLACRSASNTDVTALRRKRNWHSWCGTPGRARGTACQVKVYPSLTVPITSTQIASATSFSNGARSLAVSNNKLCARSTSPETQSGCLVQAESLAACQSSSVPHTLGCAVPDARATITPATPAGGSATQATRQTDPQSAPIDLLHAVCAGFYGLTTPRRQTPGRGCRPGDACHAAPQSAAPGRRSTGRHGGPAAGSR